jgi:hypothetical protein
MDLRASQEEDQHDELFVCQDISSRVERNRLSRELSSLLAIFSFLGPRVILDLARLSGVGCVRETGWGQECCLDPGGMPVCTHTGRSPPA